MSWSKLITLAACTVALAACGSSGQRPKPAKLMATKTNTLGINIYLWRGALDTISFMPIAQVDSNGGVILTDWYINPQAPNERVKVSVFILDQDLRADALRVTAQRQENRSGTWVDVPVRAGTVQKLEEAILTRARQIRQGSVSASS